jgi:hypothetical protein
VSGGPIDCSAATTACSAAAKAYEDVVLTATPAAGSLFTGWSGACSGTGTCTVPAGISAAAVTATFGLPDRTLTVTTAGSGQVTATGLACPGDCSETYASGTVVTVTATPAAGWRFTGWSGGGCGTAVSCDVMLDADKAIEATFTATFARVDSVAPGDVTPPPNDGTAPPNDGGSPPAATGAPGTVIRGVKLRSRQARFEFRAIGKATAFRCALAKGRPKKAPKLAPCRSPRAFSRLRARRYTFFVAAVGPGGTDKTPARHSFRIHR